MYTRASQRDSNGRAAVATSSPPLKPEKFTVYQNPTLSAALTTATLRPSSSSLFLLFSLSFLSAVAFFVFSSREYSFIDKFKVTNVSEEIAYLLVKVGKIAFGVAFMGASVALFKAIAFMRVKIGAGVVVTSSSNGAKVETCLSDRQLCLLGLKKKSDDAVPEQARKPPVSKSRTSTTALDPLFPLHQQPTSSSLSSQFGSEKSSAATSKTFVTPTKSSKSPAPNALSPTSPQMSTGKASTGLGQFSSPWSNKRASPVKVILTEDELEDFLADMDKKITESAEKIATPPTRSGFSLSSPSTISGSANTSGTTRTTPLRPVRMSPSSQKYNTPPKKGEGDIPTPMSMEESIEFFECLGIYPQIEGWRDHLRQWFSSVLLRPLLSKIGNSHNKVMQAAAKLGISITVTSISSDSSDSGGSGISPVDQATKWQLAFIPDEDGLLHQLRAYLVQAVDASTQKWNSANQQQSLQQNAILPIMQECLDAITEHQRLLALTKGELIKGLLPQSSIPSDYTVRRIKELAEGTCLKNYEYMQKEVSFDKAIKKWMLELPSDSHLLLYLFCAFLEYPKWMLHVDPSSYSGALSSKNPLFLGGLPPKERIPEKYIAVLSVIPSTIHPGACVLVIGRQCPPVLVMYWDKKLQVCLQGRTALWDSILLLCHRIKTAYGGLVRGIHLGSTALSILPLLESEEED